jgi:hypothetical protein
MRPHLQNYGTDDVYLVNEDLRLGLSLEVTEDGDLFWVSIKADGRLLGDAAIDPRSKRDTTYDAQRPAAADYPPPREDGGLPLTVAAGGAEPAGLPPSVRIGQYLTRVASLTADDLARGTPPDQFPAVDEARSFVGMYVLKLPLRPDDGDDELSTGRSEHAVGAETGSSPNVGASGTGSDGGPESTAAPSEG